MRQPMMLAWSNQKSRVAKGREGVWQMRVCRRFRWMFFFQAEDSIRDKLVTGVQTCALPIFDTAGLRTTADVVEQIGVNKAYEAMRRAAIIIYLFDAHTLSAGELRSELQLLGPRLSGSQLLLVANKCDLEELSDLQKEFSDYPDIIYISAK